MKSSIAFVVALLVVVGLVFVTLPSVEAQWGWGGERSLLDVPLYLTFLLQVMVEAMVAGAEVGAVDTAVGAVDMADMAVGAVDMADMAVGAVDMAAGAVDGTVKRADPTHSVVPPDGHSELVATNSRNAFVGNHFPSETIK